MTRAEQEAFDKWMDDEAISLDRLISTGKITWMTGTILKAIYETTFRDGYRAGFEAQHYEVDDA
jgi:hypothetical protein